MMAAVRCAARRLGGSLLQRVQAEERRRLVPSRLMRSRQLSTEEAREIQQKKEALYDAVSKAELKNKELYDALSKAGLSIDQLHLPVQGIPEQNAYQRILMYARRAQGVVELAANTTVCVVVTAAVVDVNLNKWALANLKDCSEDNVTN
ncbi:hypothetical protein ZWY2020_045697 [Hordeum vulgare]|nr:hypothetical protein ZWY2020_045697 [Hordeum vulgare]